MTECNCDGKQVEIDGKKYKLELVSEGKQDRAKAYIKSVDPNQFNLDKLFNPIRDLKTIIVAMKAGQRDFYIVWDYVDKVVEVPAIESRPTYGGNLDAWTIRFVKYNEFVKESFDTYAYLSDLNVDTPNSSTGYNKHFIFLTKSDANRYIAYRKWSGKKLNATLPSSTEKTRTNPRGLPSL